MAAQLHRLVGTRRSLENANTKGRGTMQKIAIGLTMLALLAVTGVARSAEDEKPDATIQLSGRSLAAGVGVSWGSGTLTYKGKKHAISVSGLSVGDVGATKLSASGKVYHLKKLDDFDGNYTAVGAGATVAGGGGVLTAQNQNGVRVDLVSTTKGVKVTLGAAGIDLKIKK
jgi:hypothetical protein